MRVGFDAKKIFTNYTGLGNYSRTLVESLTQYCGENNYILYTTHCIKNNDTKPFFYFENTSIHTTKYWFKWFWRLFGVVKNIKKDNLQIYHGLSNEIPFGLKKTNAKSVVTIHDLIFKIYPQTYPFFDRLIYNFKFRYACKNADKIIAISNQTKKDIISFYGVNPSKIEVIYQSCNSLYFDNNKDKSDNLKIYGVPEKYNLYVGTVNERKNLKSIILAYHLLDDLTKIPLVIVGGGGKYKKECVQLIKQLHLTTYFIWVDNMENMQHLKLTYQYANLFIYPSIYEGFGIPVMESILCKTPVITSNLSSLPEVTGGNALHIDPKNAQEIADAIKKLSSDIELRKQLVESAYVYVSTHFNAQKTAQQVNQLYKKLLNE